MDYVIRFIAGGIVVSIFAILGDMLRPKSVAGLVGAAPSVAFATLTLEFLETWSRLCRDGKPIHDFGRLRTDGLQPFGMSVADAGPTVRADRQPMRHSDMVRDRLRAQDDRDGLIC